MTDKEKIKAEVERCISDCKRSLNRVHRCSWVDAVTMLEDTLEYIPKFIDSLPEEPISEDLEKEYHNFLKREWFDKPGKTISEMMRLTAEYFANWQKQQMMKNSEPAEVGYWNQRGLSIHFDKSLERLGLEEDDKVKVLIIKND